MAKPSPLNPLGYITRRQYNDRVNIKRDLFTNRMTEARSLFRKDLLAHYGCVNAIEFSNQGDLLASGGDDKRVLIWNVNEAIHGVFKPVNMQAQHISNIFCLSFDSKNSKVFSAGNDDQVIVHDLETQKPLDFFLQEQPVYGLSINPMNDNVFASACDDGRILIYDIREPACTDPFCLASSNSPFHAVMFNPVDSRILTTANSKHGVGLWDIRKPEEEVMHYGLNRRISSQSCMSVRFNKTGTHILALRRRLLPVLYAVDQREAICQFDDYGYYNSCTMKSCCFAGLDDEYVVSGSDNFTLYLWKIPKSDTPGQIVDEAHLTLKGHRSIVNQVRFNSTHYILASSGVEKLIKFWSPFKLPESQGSLEKELDDESVHRRVFTHEEYIRLVLRSEQFMSHDYSHQSTKEDPRMMAFFDSLVQREIEGWLSEDESFESQLNYMIGDEVSPLSPPPPEAAIAPTAHQLGNNEEPALPYISDESDTVMSDNETDNTAPVEGRDAQNCISEMIARKRNQTKMNGAEGGGEGGSTSSGLSHSQGKRKRDGLNGGTATSSYSRYRKKRRLWFHMRVTENLGESPSVSGLSHSPASSIASTTDLDDIDDEDENNFNDSLDDRILIEETESNSSSEEETHEDSYSPDSTPRNKRRSKKVKRHTKVNLKHLEEDWSEEESPSNHPLTSSDEDLEDNNNKKTSTTTTTSTTNRRLKFRNNKSKKPRQYVNNVSERIQKQRKSSKRTKSEEEPKDSGCTTSGTSPKNNNNNTSPKKETEEEEKAAFGPVDGAPSSDSSASSSSSSASLPTTYSSDDSSHQTNTTTTTTTTTNHVNNKLENTN